MGILSGDDSNTDPKDRDLADLIAKILREQPYWSQVQVDPTLRSLGPANDYKVVFLYQQETKRFDRLFQAFKEGDLLNPCLANGEDVVILPAWLP